MVVVAHVVAAVVAKVVRLEQLPLGSSASSGTSKK